LEGENQREQLPRIAASSYLNTAPLIRSYLNGPLSGDVNLLTHEAPAECSRMLEQGIVDAALVPVIQYQRLSDVFLVPDVCVGSKSEVRSVVLATRRESLRDIRSIALDTSSRTSAAMLRILYSEFIGTLPEFRSAQPDIDTMLSESDAALIIGDPAMTFPRNGLKVFDLASLWRSYTGLGFVFAMWMLRGKNPLLLQKAKFRIARDQGLQNASAIAREYSTDLKLPVEELEGYLLHNISYSLDDEMTEGMKLYFELALKHGLIDSLKPLRFAEGI
jgi:chorismate dehydratase